MDWHNPTLVAKGTAMRTREYTPISEDEYLRLEAQSPVRHEYVNGEMFAMTGGTLRHNTIALNLATALRTHLRDTPCKAFINDVRVRVAKTSAYYYPDLLVACAQDTEPLDLSAMTVENPILVIEVLSTTTAATDRREKLLAYRTIPSLAEYVLISQDEAHLEIHRRRGDIGWDKIEYSGDETVELASVELKIGTREIYEGVPMQSLDRPPGQP